MIKKIKILSILTLFVFVSSLTLMAGPKSSALDEAQIDEITKKVYPSVVKVVVKNGFTKVATGVVIDRDGHVVTTALISPRDEKITIVTTDKKEIEAEFLGMDSETHLAVVKAKDKDLTPVNMGDMKNISPGTWVGVVSISPEETPQVTQGIVSSVSPERLRLNVWVVRGASGSPVLDKGGRMIGLLRGVYTEESPVILEFREKAVEASGFVFSKAEAPASGMAVAIPVDIVKSITVEIKEKGRVQRGWLGVGIFENEDGHVEIEVVEEKSPAELAKLEEGDVILQIEGKNLTNKEMLHKEIRKRKPGQTVTFRIKRDDKERNIRVKLGEYTEEDAWREMEMRFPRLFVEPEEKFLEVAPRTRVQRFGLETRKYIGVYVDSLNNELAEYFGAKEGKGLLVSQIREGSPAEKAGLKVGDVLVKADGTTLEREGDLSYIIQKKEKGDKIKIEFYRDKRMRSVEVEIEEEEGSGLLRFSPEDWKDYTETWDKSYESILRQQRKWRDDSARDLRKQMERMNREMQIQQQKSLDATQKLLKSGKFYKKIIWV
jgi:S1-C subfamily serine protease